jgi:hypothetical protein
LKSIVNINKATPIFMITDIRSLINRLDAIEEGAIGAAIGGGLGGLAGSALGPIGTAGGAAAGAALGSKVGDYLSSIFNHRDSSIDTNHPVVKDTSSPTGFSSGVTGDNVHPPEQGFKNKDNKTDGGKVDALGVPDGGYSAYPQMIFSPSPNLKEGGEYTYQIQKAEEGRRRSGNVLKILGTYRFNDATLAVFEKDQPLKHWVDLGAVGGVGDSREDWEPQGYKFVGSQMFSSTNKFGDCLGQAEKYKGSMLKSDIVVAATWQLVAFTKPDGNPGIHCLGVEYVGPEQLWSSRGVKALTDLVNSIDLKGVEQLKK